LKQKLILLSAFLTILIILCADNHPRVEKSVKRYVSIDLGSIKKRGKLIAVTDFNSTDYFIYKGEPMGFNFDLLRSLSDHIGVDVEIITENDPEKAAEMLNKGKADLLAMELDSDALVSKELTFTEPIDETRLVLVQRKPDNWRSLGSGDLEGKLVRNTIQLAGKSVFVQVGTTGIDLLSTIVSQAGNSISLIEVPYGQEQLIQHVADGEIDYTVCNENIAEVNSTYYPDIDVSTVVSFPHGFAWGVRKNNSDTLIKELNHWISAYKQTGSYRMLYTKYFRNLNSSTIVRSDYYALSTGKVSPYDDMIRKYSAIINWDWRLLASLIYQESRFKSDVTSGAGAYGLMQVLPATGKNFGVDITSSPENNMKAGIRYINWLHSIFDPLITDEKERLNFILASYNAGPGHVLDAMKLADKNGMDPHKWNGSVEVWLQNKSQPKYYNDAVVKNGYFKGKESVAFVSQVIDRYEHYKNIIPARVLK
jgi:membrane-bound lytic murein transglycosylase F